MMLAGIITTPMIPSSYAKTSIMAPLIGQVCEAVGAEPNSQSGRGLWFANFMGTYILGIAFMSGSAFVALMIGFMQGLAFTWGSWLKCTIVWYLVLIVLTYLYCTIICKPKEKLAGDVTFLKEQYKGARRHLQEGEAGHHHRCHRHYPLDHPEAARRGRRLRGHRG